MEELGDIFLRDYVQVSAANYLCLLSCIGHTIVSQLLFTFEFNICFFLKIKSKCNTASFLTRVCESNERVKAVGGNSTRSIAHSLDGL